MSDQPTPALLRARLGGLMLRDEHRLARRLASRRGDGDLEAITRAVEAGEQRVALRLASVPAVSYPPQLPITSRVTEIRDAIAANQVVVIAGETGSGKTTQIPKICLELGRGVRGLIGHTQPRRIAARTVADRIAEELSTEERRTEVGGVIGYQVRFSDHSSDQTLVKIMTDGILLAEIAHDRLLRRYDTLIIDEAHERSLNIDLLLGYLAQLLPRRPDLKVIITSATIDTERFARHFSRGDAAAPIIEVSGRSYPVEVRYRPLKPESDPETGKQAVELDQPQGIVEAVRELIAAGPGDILVFCSGEREIRDATEALERTNARERLADEVIPLYARLSIAEQHRVFSPHPGRRVVLATNVAETSLTVPGIRYVIDTGNARISRYSFRTKVQRLPIEAVSQASASQRAGRCGRVADGICIRLYSEDDFESRPPFTDPEITRTNLASVLLQMAALGLGDPGEVEDFPFVDAPDRRGVRDGLALLFELGALERPGSGPAKLTAVGRQLTRIPIDPRLGRMILAAAPLGVIDDVIVIAAALSIQDPRERPSDRQAAADQSHARFADPTSDFLGMLHLWRYVTEQQRDRSSSSFRRMCTAEFLHYLRVREWQDLVTQLRSSARELDLPISRERTSEEAANPTLVHQALLAGLLSHIGFREGDKRDFLGARGSRFLIFPGSALAKKPPRWVMAAELVETSRLFARVAARIEPEWVEALAGHLMTRTYSEPHWEQKRTQVMAYERITLYGLPIVARRKIGYGAVDPEVSRDLFIRHALVEGDWRTHHTFFAANQRLREEIIELEERTRRRDLLVDDETLFHFYDQRVGAEVISGRHFDSWWKQARRRDPELLTLTPEALRADRADVNEHEFPDEVARGEARFPLSYAFEPGSAQDGVTVHVPLALLAAVAEPGRDGPDELGWQVPGRREELIVALIRSLPKSLRRNFTPPTTFATRVLPRIDPGEPLLDALERELRRETGVTVAREAWELDKLPPHLRPTFAVQDAAGDVLAAGKDLAALRKQLSPQVRQAVSATAGDLERSGLTAWPGGELPRTTSRALAGGVVTGYPALVDEGASVAVRVLATAAEQERAMWAGTRRLLMLTTSSPIKAITGRLGTRSKLVLASYPYAKVPALLTDAYAAGVDQLMTKAGGPAWDEVGFARLTAAVREGIQETTTGIVATVEQIVAEAADVAALLSRPGPANTTEARADVKAQLEALVGPGFATAAGAARLPDLRRYVKGMKRRLEQVANDAARDRIRMHEVQELQTAASKAKPEVAEEVRWMIEELRISLFAQSLGTRSPVSVQRVWRALDA
jgi:ATP-dependent helicase HrpA